MTNSSEENLKLWNDVEKTNPAHTKKVKLGRAITAIDPYQQIKNATAQFGPVGQGWGWEVKRVDIFETKEVSVLVRVWVGDQDHYVEQFGQNNIYTDNAQKKKDTDHMKKAVTDGVTKCLSCMGFNADVFLGLFDDNKYVAEMNKEFGNSAGTGNSTNSQSQGDDKPWYNDFDSQKQWFVDQINKGHAPEMLISTLQEKYKVNKKIQDSIKALGGNA